MVRLAAAETTTSAATQPVIRRAHPDDGELPQLSLPPNITSASAMASHGGKAQLKADLPDQVG